MTPSTLLEDALAERGNTIAVFANPTDGADCVIWAANAPLARILDLSPETLTGSRLKELRPLIERPEDWASIVDALCTQTSLSLDLKLRVNGREAWLGFNLTFKTNQDEGSCHGILIGRDITEARERTLRETESQRLLASVFLRTNAAMAILGGGGTVLMANLALQQLLGFGAAELLGVNVETLIPPEFAEVVGAARARQLDRGAAYIMRMQVLKKSGDRVAVTLHSALLRDASDRPLRVVTLLPDPVARDTHGRVMQVAPSDIGQVRAIDLTALRAVYVKAWPRMAERAMSMAEQIIRRRLDTSDVISRRDDCCLIWFANTDEERNQAILTGAVREVRQRLLSEAGDNVPAHVRALSIGTEPLPDGPFISPPGALSRSADGPANDSRAPLERDVNALMRYLRDGADVDARSVTGRDGVARPIVLVDFDRVARGCLYDLGPALPRESDFGTRFDLIRLDLAARVLEQQPAGTRVLLPVSWPAVGDPDCRLAFDRHLARMPSDTRSRVMLALYGVPPLLSVRRWSEAVDPLLRQLADVGLLLTYRDGDTDAVRDALTNEWPLSLLVIDRTEGPPVVIDEYLSLIATARRREVAVLVRTPAADDIRDWRKLGATMFVTAAG